MRGVSCVYRDMIINIEFDDAKYEKYQFVTPWGIGDVEILWDFVGF